MDRVVYIYLALRVGCSVGMVEGRCACLLCFDDTTLAYDACFLSDRRVMGGSG